MVLLGASAVTDELLGPLGALVLVLGVLGLFLRGLILSRNTVPREDFKQLQDVHATAMAGLGDLTRAVQDLAGIIERDGRTGTG